MLEELEATMLAENKVVLVVATDAEPSEAQPALTQPTRILVVDDDPDAADLLSEALGAAGYEVRAAYDGAAALILAAAFHPEMALLDLGLPGMSGFELARALLATAGLETLKLIAVTGYGLAQARQRAIESGFKAHILKPIEFKRLEREIERLIGS